MRFFLFVFLISIFLPLHSKAQLNIELLHQLVKHSKDEYDRQQTARNRQALVSANEEINKEESAKLKDRYRELHSRMKVVGLALEGLSLGSESEPLVSEVIKQQERIVKLVANHPQLILLGIDSERELAGRSLQLARFLTGLFVSIDDLNQMKASDRRVLYGHVINELRLIAGTSKGLANALEALTRQKMEQGSAPFAAFADSDKQLVERVLKTIN